MPKLKPKLNKRKEKQLKRAKILFDDLLKLHKDSENEHTFKTLKQIKGLMF